MTSLISSGQTLPVLAAKPACSRETPITAIDSHAHVFTRELPLVPLRRHAPEHDATLIEYLNLLDVHGVSHGVLVQPSFLGTDNAFMLNALRSHPKRLRGVAVVAPETDDSEFQLLADCGVCGIRLNLIGLPLPALAAKPWSGLLARVRSLGWHVELHREASDLHIAGQAILDAGCKLVVDHFGRPGHATEISKTWLSDAAQSGSTWVKLSAAYRNWPDACGPQARTAARVLLSEFGPSRLVWGSDWPHTQHADKVCFTTAHAALADWVPDVSKRRQILVDTPARLFQFTHGDFK